MRFTHKGVKKIDIKEVFGNSGEESKFLSRFFALFSEEITKIWANENRKKWKYKNLGRPTIYKTQNNQEKRSTLDFTFKNKKGDIFVVEQKCWIQYQDFKFLNATAEDIMKELYGYIFIEYLDNVKNKAYKVKVNQEIKNISGVILIWAKIDEDNRKKLMNEFKFADVISMENIIQELVNEDNQEYKELIRKYKKYVDDFCKNII
jgi:hypothetical protein